MPQASHISGKENRRVRYTKMVLRQSLLELLEEKPIEKITVSDLCSRADLNRTTFYLFYCIRFPGACQTACMYES